MVIERAKQRFRPTEAELIEMVCDNDEGRAGMRDHARTSEFVAAIHDELIVLYPDEWVGAHEQKVIAHGPTIHDVISQLSAAGVTPGHAYVTYLRSTAQARSVTL